MIMVVVVMVVVTDMLVDGNSDVGSHVISTWWYDCTNTLKPFF
jgi:hypothetical protein